MINSVKKRPAFVLVLVMAGILGISLSAQDDPIRKGVNRVGLKDADQLLRLIEREDITTSVKIRAMQRVASLYRENREEAEPQAQKFIQSLSGALQNLKKDENPHFHYKVRSSACMALGDFDNSDHGASAIGVIKEALLNDPNPQVIQTCAQSLGEFRNNRSSAADALIERVNKSMGEPTIKYGDMGVMSVSIASLAKLKQKKAFIPLMKVLQSGYPDHVKKEADRAIASFDLE